MARPTVSRVTAEGPAITALDRVDDADAYEIAVDPALPADADWWRRKALGDPPALMSVLLRARDLAVRPLGLVGGPMTRVPVVASVPGEQVIGLDDRHLDFRLGVRVAGGRLRMTTAVRFHGLAGRAYFTPVRPVHGRLVMPGMLRRAARAGAPPRPRAPAPGRAIAPAAAHPARRG